MTLESLIHESVKIKSAREDRCHLVKVASKPHQIDSTLLHIYF